MRVRDLRFVGAFLDLAACPADRPAVAIVGRSNVGKSSLLNRLVGQAIARTSKTPGRTRQLIWFAVETDRTPPFYLVDLPGYGYAAGPAAERQQFARAARAFLGDASRLAGVLQLVDVSVPWQDSDVESLSWLLGDAIPFALVFTKVDRVNRSGPGRHLSELRGRVPWRADIPVLPTSAKDNEGIVGVRKWLEQVLQRPWPAAGEEPSNR
jgi:GTP-binding protein